MTVGRSSSPTHQTGQQAEDWALDFLRRQGFTLVAQNFHSRLGEIDLIMSKDQLLIFCEVRTRKSSSFGGAAASVTPAKQRKISQTANQFIQSFPQFESYECRFDVIAIDLAGKNAAQQQNVDWLEGAFDARFE
jgi:putative endonuclease